MARTLDLGSVIGPQGPKGETGATGATGPQGPKGDAGATGAKGATGATGARGSQWWAGTGIAGTSTTATVFSSSGVSEALVGDWYLNTGTGLVYQCTVGGAASAAKWAYKGSIKGAKGDTGATGAKGDTGATGATGPQGPKGDTGAKGATGAQGPAGADAPVPTFSVNASGHLIATYAD